MQEEAMAVLSWAEAELAKNTWPREDYRELLRLTIATLGGVVPGFQFLQPGPDHHARWMSKCLYYLKMKLLSNVFTMSEEEKSEVEEISPFILILYVKAFLFYWNPLSGFDPSKKSNNIHVVKPTAFTQLGQQWRNEQIMATPR